MNQIYSLKGLSFPVKWDKSKFFHCNNILKSDENMVTTSLCFFQIFPDLCHSDENQFDCTKETKLALLSHKLHIYNRLFKYFRYAKFCLKNNT